MVSALELGLDGSHLGGLEKWEAALVDFVWEVDNEDTAKHCKEYGHCAVDNEDPMSVSKCRYLRKSTNQRHPSQPFLPESCMQPYARIEPKPLAITLIL